MDSCDVATRVDVNLVMPFKLFVMHVSDQAHQLTLLPGSQLLRSDTCDWCLMDWSSCGAIVTLSVVCFNGLDRLVAEAALFANALSKFRM